MSSTISELSLKSIKFLPKDNGIDTDKHAFIDSCMSITLLKYYPSMAQKKIQNKSFKNVTYAKYTYAKYT